MNKKLKGFSLAELLISLLIISIVLSAAIPTLTRRSGANREYVWSWSTHNNIAYFGTGGNQSAVIGYDKNPIMSKIDDNWQLTNPLAEILYDEDNINNIPPDPPDPDPNRYRYRGIRKVNLGGVIFNGTGDKLILLKKPILARNASNEEEKNKDESMFANSHITFYTLKNTTSLNSPTTNDIKYAGRIAMDQGNIAMGIGTLQNQIWDKRDSHKNMQGENTAIGHFALLRNEEGIRNTAIGKKTLSANRIGSYNTSLGFGSLYELGSENPPNGLTIDIIEPYFDNTSIGAHSQQHNSIGKRNTSVGAHSLQTLKYNSESFNEMNAYNPTNPSNVLGDSNTAIGYNSILNLKLGDENTAIGNNACSSIILGSNNICIGSNIGTSEHGGKLYKDDYGVYIGSSTKRTSAKDAPYQDIGGEEFNIPLISGHSRRTTSTYKYGGSEHKIGFDQELNVNARQVVFRPYNAEFDAFIFESMIGGLSTEKKFDPDNPSLSPYFSGYGDNNKLRWARASFNLRDTGLKKSTDSSYTTSDKTSVQLQFGASAIDKNVAGYSSIEESVRKMAFIDAFDPHHFDSDNILDRSNSLAPIYFNKMLKFSFPYRYNFSEYDSHKEDMIVRIDAVGRGNDDKPDERNLPLRLNDKITIKNETYAPTMTIQAGKFYLASEKPNATDPAKTEIQMFVPGGSSTANQSIIDIKQAESNENGVKITQKTGTNKFEIVQLGSSKEFNIFHGAIESKETPRLQINNGTFYALKLSEATIEAQKVTIQGGENSEILLGTVKVKEDITNLKNQVSSLSDIRLKNVSGDSTAGLKEINALEVKNFTFKNDKEKTPHVGVIAQQLQKIFPAAVTKGEDGYLRIRTEDIFYAMVNSIKDLFKQLQDLTAKVTGLDNRITELEKQNKLLQEQNKLLKKQNKAIEKRLAKLERQAAK